MFHTNLEERHTGKNSMENNFMFYGARNLPTLKVGDRVRIILYRENIGTREERLSQQILATGCVL